MKTCTSHGLEGRKLAGERPPVAHRNRDPEQHRCGEADDGGRGRRQGGLAELVEVVGGGVEANANAHGPVDEPGEADDR